MSVDITIQKQGVAQQLDDVDKLRVSKYGTSGREDFVPETEAEFYVRGTIEGVMYKVTVDANGYLVYTEES